MSSEWAKQKAREYADGKCTGYECDSDLEVLLDLAIAEGRRQKLHLTEREEYERRINEYKSSFKFSNQA